MGWPRPQNRITPAAPGGREQPGEPDQEARRTPGKDIGYLVAPGDGDANDDDEHAAERAGSAPRGSGDRRLSSGRCGSRRVRDPPGARGGERTERHRPPALGGPWPGTRRSGPARPPRRREPRRRSRCRPPPARLATARSPPPGRRRPGGHCPAPPTAWWRTPPLGAASRSRPIRALSRRATDPGRRSPSTASSRTAFAPAGGRRPLVSRRWRSERSPHRAPSSRSRRPARRCSRQVRRPSNKSRCASEVLLGNAPRLGLRTRCPARFSASNTVMRPPLRLRGGSSPRNDLKGQMPYHQPSCVHRRGRVNGRRALSGSGPR